MTVSSSEMPLSSNVESIKCRVSSNLRNSDQEFWSASSDEARSELESSQRRGDEDLSNACWFLKTVCKVRGRFIAAIESIRREQYYEAWCELERVEIDLGTLLRNPIFDPCEFEVSELLDLVQEWQKIYPYKLFMSPEMLHKLVRCSICSKEINPWSECNHVPGIVYNGTVCVHIVAELEFLSISIVEDPVQKYSVMHRRRDENGRDVDIYSYETVRFVVDRISCPFDGFRVVWTKAIHPHRLFPNAVPGGPCPCESGRKYSDCCLERHGVLRPHMHIDFEREPEGDLPCAELIGYDTRKGSVVASKINE